MRARLPLGVLLVVGLALAVTGGDYQITAISGTPAGIGRYIIEDIRMSDDMQTAWMVGVANSDDAHLYAYDLAQDKVQGFCDLGVLYGPRGTSGMDICGNYACVVNYPTNTVSIIDLRSVPLSMEGPECSQTEVSLPGYYISAEIPVPLKPTGCAFNYPRCDRAIVTGSFSDTVTLIGIDPSSATAEILCEVEAGMGPNQVGPLGAEAVYIANRYSDDVTVIDLQTCGLSCKGHITGLDRVPQAIAITPDGKKAYVADFVGNMVDVIDISAKAVVKKIPVGESPRYITVSTDGKFVYVSNTIDKTISVISTACDCVVDTIQVVGPNEPAPIGAIAVTKDNRYLYVWYTGGRSSTYGDFIIFKIDVSPLYGG